MIQLDISGATRDEPAPVSVAEAVAVATVAMHATIASAAVRKPNNLLRIKGILSACVIVGRRAHRPRNAPWQGAGSLRERRPVCQFCERSGISIL